MKKLIGVALAATALLGLSACAPAEESTGSSNYEPTPEEQAEIDAEEQQYFESLVRVVSVTLTDGSTIDCVIVDGGGSATCLEFTREF